jgi:hypothetical protein
MELLLRIELTALELYGNKELILSWISKTISWISFNSYTLGQKFCIKSLLLDKIYVLNLSSSLLDYFNNKLRSLYVHPTIPE